MAGVRLRPQAERAHRRAAARGVERDERIQQERNVVAREVEIALVDLGDPGQLIQILDERRLPGLWTMLPSLAEADAGQLFERLALGVVGDLVIELAAHDEIDRGLVRSAFSGSTVTGGPTNATFSFGFDVLHHLARSSRRRESRESR